MNYDIATFDHLLEIVIESKTNDDIANRLMADLAVNTNDPVLLYKLCESSTKKAEKSGYAQLRQAIKFALLIVKRLSVGQYKDIGDKILELVMSDKVIGRGYYELCESLVEILEDRRNAERVLRREFEILKAGIPNNRKITMSVETRDGVESFDEMKDVCVSDFTKLAYVWEDMFGKSALFSEEVVEFAVNAIECDCFVDLAEVGEWYTHVGKQDKAIEYLHRAEHLVKSFEDQWILCHNIWLNFPNERNFAMEQMLNAIKMGRRCEDFVSLGEICGNTINGICDKELCLKLFEKGQKVAKNSKELESLKDSLDMVRESWEDEEREKDNG